MESIIIKEVKTDKPCCACERKAEIKVIIGRDKNCEGDKTYFCQECYVRAFHEAFKKQLEELENENISKN